MQTFSKNISLSAGDYTFRIRQPGVSADKSNIFEGFSVRRCDAVIGENGYLTFEDALIAADAGATILWDMDAAGNAYDFAFGLNWSGVIKDERVAAYSVEPLSKVENMIFKYAE